MHARMKKMADVDTIAPAKQSRADAALLSWLDESASRPAARCTGIAAGPTAIGTYPIGFAAPADVTCSRDCCVVWPALATAGMVAGIVLADRRAKADRRRARQQLFAEEEFDLDETDDSLNDLPVPSQESVAAALAAWLDESAAGETGGAASSPRPRVFSARSAKTFSGRGAGDEGSLPCASPRRCATPRPNTQRKRCPAARSESELGRETRTGRRACKDGVGRREPCGTRGNLWRIVAAVCVVLGLLVGGLLLSGGVGEASSSARRLGTGEGAAGKAAVFQLANGAWASRIDAIRVGQRVLAELPEGVEADWGEADTEGEPEAVNWRKLTLQAAKADGTFARVELLRSLRWIARHEAREGGTVDISVPECGIAGRAEVLAIGPCPRIPPGPGRVVTGTFAHRSAKIVDVYVEGLSAPIGTTANHPFWSEDRRAFVRADALKPGELLRAILPEDEDGLNDGGLAAAASNDDGLAEGDASNDDGRTAGAASADDGLDSDGYCFLRVVRVVPRGEPEPVFNLEVQFAHVYHVTAAGVLVHNARDSCAELAVGQSPQVAQPHAPSAQAPLKLTETVANHATDVVTKGPFKGELARPFINSPLTMQEIMAAGKPVPDAIKAGALRWNVPGAFRGSAGTWELVVAPATNTVLHFNFVTP